jgi:hypothetical protein
MTHRPSRAALAAALLALAACADSAPLLDTAAAPRAPCSDSIDLQGNARAVVVADFDGDGRPDLAAATYDGKLVVVLGRRGGFAAPRTVAAVVASPLVAADFDGDGKLDLAVAGEASVGVLLGKGDGSFQPVKSSAVPPPAKPSVHWLDVVGGDVDGDGKPDLVMVYAPGSTTTLFGNGDGTFRVGPTSTLCDYDRIRAVAGGDFDGDGKLDLACVRKSIDPGKPVSAAVSLGNGDGTFRWKADTGLFDHSAHDDSQQAIAVGDLDGDGKLDLVAYTPRTGILLTARGKGDGTLEEPSFYRGGGFPVAIADIDGDGKAEVLTKSCGGVSVIARDRDGSLRLPRSFRIREGETDLTGRVAVGDFNRDGLTDVAVTILDNVAIVSVFLADGRGGMRRGAAFLPTGDPSIRAELVAADVDGDGILDLVDADLLSVSLGNGDGSFRDAFYDNLVSASGIALADFDGDGKLDAALYRADRPGLTLRLGQGDGTFPKERTITVPVSGNIGAVAAADLDGDGHSDLVVSAGGSLLVLLGKGDGTFAAAQPVPGGAASAIAAVDLDGDHRIDLIVSSAGGSVSTVLLNAGGGVFRPAGTVPASGQLRVADLDGDRIPDLLVFGDSLVSFRGKADGTFEAARSYGFGGSDFGVADLDGDGRAEIVLAAGNRSPFLTVLPGAPR